MLVETLFNIIYLLIDVLTLGIKVPFMPAKVGELLGILLEYISTGIAILGAYFDMSYLLILFGIIILVDASVTAYKLIMWILSKIPVLNIH